MINLHGRILLNQGVKILDVVKNGEFFPFYISKVDTKNDERNEKLKQYLDKKNENGLMPNSLTDANVETPILLSPKTGIDVFYNTMSNYVRCKYYYANAVIL